jgi:hypothetical protein
MKSLGMGADNYAWAKSYGLFSLLYGNRKAMKIYNYRKRLVALHYFLSIKCRDQFHKKPSLQKRTAQFLIKKKL